jgi:hypothetical protein
MGTVGSVSHNPWGVQHVPVRTSEDSQEAKAVLSDPSQEEERGQVDADTDPDSGKKADKECISQVPEVWTPAPEGYSYNLVDQFVPMPIRGPDGHIWPAKFTRVEYTDNPTVHGFWAGSPTPYSDHLYASPFFDL